MDRTFITLTGSSQAALVDRDIAHIARAMRLALHGDLGGPILPPAYWRKRLYALLDTGNLSHAQLCSVDSLLLQLDQFALESQLPWDALTPAVAALIPPPFTADAVRPA
ncbi:hypothetical protein LFL96_04740 [Paraburkholderia sp. D15]|uniref:hypothetical protein n=1 Tax=Paraburkholderia sp. D15 TaxID=2880218 RepID=UPI002479DD10|nr:hypothetical protein [Paraburkholderia sp. D15]WGS50818.1 hypothetical protein LFL96_04740 [Paraburkholderia sp. D15]WKF58754.1 hypothetical protein HUO10_003255 [Paraburkholderia busanensis]